MRAPEALLELPEWIPCAEPPARPRILLVANDAEGDDSLARSALVSEALLDEFPSAAMAIVTGSLAAGRTRIPSGVELIQLPGLATIPDGFFATKSLEMLEDRIRDARRVMLHTAIAGFEPDLVVVDDHPLGRGGELGEALSALRSLRPATRCVLGIQELKGTPAHLSRPLARSGLLEAAEQLYDEIWIYGAREVFDTVREYGFPEGLARKAHYCGYLQRKRVPSHSRSGAPRVLIDAADDASAGCIVECYLEGLRWLGAQLALRSSVCFGSGVSTELRNELVRRFGHVAGVEFHDTVDHPERLYAQSDVVISTACYRSVCEILSFGHRAVLVPRDQADREQAIRAHRLGELKICEVIDPHALEPDLLMARTLDALESGRRRRGSIDLGGLPHLGERARAMLASPR